MNEPKKQTGFLWKLTAEEKEALREVCDYARAFAVDCVLPEVFDCVKLKITQLLGEEE